MTFRSLRLAPVVAIIGLGLPLLSPATAATCRWIGWCSRR